MATKKTTMRQRFAKKSTSSTGKVTAPTSSTTRDGNEQTSSPRGVRTTTHRKPNVFVAPAETSAGDVVESGASSELNARTLKAQLSSAQRGRQHLTSQQQQQKLRQKSRIQRLKDRQGNSTHIPTAAEERFQILTEELQLFDQVLQVPEYEADPFAAISMHLSQTMENLKPLTKDVGRADPTQ